MKIKRLLVFTLACLSVSSGALAKGTGIETSVLWPFYPGNHGVLRAAIPLASDGGDQLILGVRGHNPHNRSKEGRFSSLAAHGGYRAFFWKGLHADFLAHFGVGRIRGSVVDGKDYDSFDIDVMAVAGWRFDFGPLYALVQPLGIGSVLYRSNPWEIVGEGRRTTEPPIFVANILVGWQF
ncbi:MAG: hypothetical protein ACK5QT_00095 [Oligoflexia bacterium]|jgi:hypothetical protein